MIESDYNFQGVAMEHFQTTEASLGTAIVIQFNEYTGTREEYWAESFVKVILNVSMLRENIVNQYS